MQACRHAFLGHHSGSHEASSVLLPATMLTHSMLSCNQLLAHHSFSEQKRSREGAYSAKDVARPDRRCSRCSPSSWQASALQLACTMPKSMDTWTACLEAPRAVRHRWGDVAGRTSCFLQNPSKTLLCSQASNALASLLFKDHGIFDKTAPGHPHQKPRGVRFR